MVIRYSCLLCNIFYKIQSNKSSKRISSTSYSIRTFLPFVKNSSSTFISRESTFFTISPSFFVLDKFFVTLDKKDPVSTIFPLLWPFRTYVSHQNSVLQTYSSTPDTVYMYLFKIHCTGYNRYSVEIFVNFPYHRPKTWESTIPPTPPS